MTPLWPTICVLGGSDCLLVTLHYDPERKFSLALPCAKLSLWPEWEYVYRRKGETSLIVAEGFAVCLTTQIWYIPLLSSEVKLVNLVCEILWYLKKEGSRITTVRCTNFNQPKYLKNKNHLDATYYFIVLLIGTTYFGHYYAHHQELATIMLITTLVVSFLVCCRFGVRCG